MQHRRDSGLQAFNSLWDYLSFRAQCWNASRCLGKAKARAWEHRSLAGFAHNCLHACTPLSPAKQREGSCADGQGER